jgi:hypothetical protein
MTPKQPAAKNKLGPSHLSRCIITEERAFDFATLYPLAKFVGFVPDKRRGAWPGANLRQGGLGGVNKVPFVSEKEQS